LIGWRRVCAFDVRLKARCSLAERRFRHGVPYQPVRECEKAEYISPANAQA